MNVFNLKLTDMEINRVLCLGELKNLVGLIHKGDNDGIKSILSSFSKCRIFFESGEEDVMAKSLEFAGVYMKSFKECIWVFQNAEGELKQRAINSAIDLTFTFKDCNVIYNLVKKVDRKMGLRVIQTSSRFKEFVWLSERLDGENKDLAIFKAGLLMRKQEHYKWVYYNAKGELKEKALLLASRSLSCLDDCFWVHKATRMAIVADEIRKNVINAVKTFITEDNKRAYAC